MRRNRGIILNATIFPIALILIFYLNSPVATHSPKLFAWNEIRYRSSSRTLPASRGRCPGLSPETSKPVLIVARIASEPLSVFDDLSSLYHICPYTADATPDDTSTYLQTPANRGHESMAYLTFIIDNYDNLPGSGMVFVHGSRFAWHNDDPLYDNVSLLKQMNVSRALWGPPGPATGYWNMKCDWSAGMCDGSREDSKPQGSMETSMRAMLESGNKRAISDAALSGALESIFGGPLARTQRTLPITLGRSDPVRSQCCAQFVVARENIQKHTKGEYIALRQWLLDGMDTVNHHGYKEVRDGARTRAAHAQHPHILNQNGKGPVFSNPAPVDDLVAGRILSYLWHILFLPSSPQQAAGGQPGEGLMSDDTVGENAGVDLEYLNKLACPRADECYCRLYGRCDLDGCTTPGRCRGQYRLPPDYKLPKNWAETHS